MELKSGDVLLRLPVAADAAAMATIGNNAAIARNMRDMFPHPYAIADAERFIGFVGEGVMGHVRVICYKDQLAGVISVIPQQDIYRHTAEIGYWLGEPFWKKGIATIAVGLMCRYAFEELKLSRLYAGVFSYNDPSKKVLQNNGFVLEGIRRNGVVKNGKLIDEYYYALVKES